MMLSDLKDPRSLQLRCTGSGTIASSPISGLRFAAPALLILSCAAFGATVSHAQDQQDQSVAEAARQARARKQEAQKTSKHVYTEEDLKHPQILTPEDRAQVEAKRNDCSQKNNCSSSPAQDSPAALDANSETPATSLGEVARQYRKQKELQDQKQKELQALKPKPSEPFHLPFSTPSLASPVVPERAMIRPPSAPVLRSGTSLRITRRDPFARARLTPEVRLPEVPLSGVSHPKLSLSENSRHFNVYRPEVSNPEPSRHEAPNRRVSLAEAFAKLRPSFSQPVRPAPPAHLKVLPRPVPPTFSIRPLQPMIPLNFVRPASPAESVRPLKPLSSGPTSSSVAAQKTISLQRGDSLWKLARQNLGTGRRWPELLTVNSWIADPNQIRAGARLSLPVITLKSSPSVASPDGSTRTIKVRKGDTLWTLAKANLGRSSAWPCLAAANPLIANPDRIFEGELLVVSSACGSASTHSSSNLNP